MFCIDVGTFDRDNGFTVKVGYIAYDSQSLPVILAEWLIPSNYVMELLANMLEVPEMTSWYIRTDCADCPHIRIGRVATVV